MEMLLNLFEVDEETMNKEGKNKISVVFPIFNEEENLKELYLQVRKELEKTDVSFEMVFVDNASTDRSLDIVKELRHKDNRVRYVSLSRNFGHQGGLFAGLSYCTGEAVIMMDADLQHPPSLIPEMIHQWKEGYEVVYTTKRNTYVSALLYWQFRLFYKIISKMSGLNLSFGRSDFCLLDRKVVDTILNIPEYHKFLRGTVEWLGFRQKGISYDVENRHKGTSKFSYWTRVSFALDGILSFSALPLRLITLCGFFIAFLSIMYGTIALIMGLMLLLGFSVPLPSGWATLAVSVMFLGSVQLIAIGVLGEYVSRIYEQTKGRPVFVVRETSDRME